VTPSWELRLGTGVPVALEVDVASGRADLDLSGVRLETLALDGGSGALQLTLPATGYYAWKYPDSSGYSFHRRWLNGCRLNCNNHGQG